MSDARGAEPPRRRLARQLLDGGAEPKTSLSRGTVGSPDPILQFSFCGSL
jgi:hypothetical protein